MLSLSFSLHSVHTAPRSLLLLVSRSWSASLGRTCSVTSSRSTLARRAHTRESGDVRLSPKKKTSHSCLFDPRLDSTRLVRQTGISRRVLPDDLRPLTPPPPRFDALPVESTTLRTGRQRRRRGQEGESVLEVREQQSGSESDKGLDSSSHDDRRSSSSRGNERITSRFTVQETGLWR